METRDTPTVDVAANLARVRDQAAAAAGRARGAVDIIAISKVHGADRIQPALAVGHRSFGENRVQEAQRKWPPLKERYTDMALHLIGPLQTNKAAAAVALFDVIQTVDRPKLAKALAKEMDASARRPACMIQVNIGDEPQKAGVAIGDLPGLLVTCRETLGLPIVGLMCIPPADEDPAPFFALLAKLAARHQLDQLSMGMSADFETAITLGATAIRIGTAIFGARPVPAGTL